MFLLQGCRCCPFQKGFYLWRIAYKLVYYVLDKTGELEGNSDVSGKSHYYSCMHCNWLSTRPAVEE